MVSARDGRRRRRAGRAHRAFHAGPGWLFLTGKKEDIKLLARKLGLLSTDEAPVNRDGHTPELMVGNVPTGQWMRNSAVDNPRYLAATIGGMLDGWKRYRPSWSYATSAGAGALARRVPLLAPPATPSGGATASGPTSPA